MSYNIYKFGMKFVVTIQMVYFVYFAVITVQKIELILSKPPPGRSVLKPEEEEEVVEADGAKNDKYDVIIVGGGIGGLVAGVSCQQTGLRCLVLERKKKGCEEQGADVALWPSAVRILTQLGVDRRFFENGCFGVDTVDMCKFDFEVGAEGVMKRIDMEKVVEGKAGKFVLVPRKELMEAVTPLVNDSESMGGIKIEHNCNVVRVEEYEERNQASVEYVTSDGKTVRARSRVCVGADGARSSVRHNVVNKSIRKRRRSSKLTDNDDNDDDIKFCNEVCYRGVLRRGKTPSELFDIIEQHSEHAKMKINYGAGLRSSFGFMSADRSVAYWWVKSPASKRPRSSSEKLQHCSWPEPLKSLHDTTSTEDFYVHAIEEGRELERWSSLRTTLIGDAAHVLSPNMGQGACLAIEDAFIFSLLLKKYWKWDDGHLEAMYEYERIRRPFANNVRSEARKQLFLGQLKHPLLVKFRELLLRKVPSKVLEKKLAANCFDIDEYLDLHRELKVPYAPQHAKVQL